MNKNGRKIKIEIEVSEYVGLNLGVFIHTSALGSKNFLDGKNSRLSKTISKIGKDIVNQVIEKGKAKEAKAEARKRTKL